jgi:hypothetical protein
MGAARIKTFSQYFVKTNVKKNPKKQNNRKVAWKQVWVSDY